MPDENHVDILCVMDGESLIRDYWEATHHGAKTHKFPYKSEEIKPYCRMITRDGSSLHHETVSAELTVRARVDDIVRWWATTLTTNDEYRVEITRFYDFEHEICDQPQPMDTSDPLERFWQTRIKKKGSDSYWLNFKIVHPQTGREVSFDWDPTIQVDE